MSGQPGLRILWDLRQIGGQSAKLCLELVVHDKNGELRPLAIALGLREREKLLLYVLLELGDGISDWHASGGVGMLQIRRY